MQTKIKYVLNENQSWNFWNLTAKSGQFKMAKNGLENLNYKRWNMQKINVLVTLQLIKLNLVSTVLKPVKTSKPS